VEHEDKGKMRGHANEIELLDNGLCRKVCYRTPYKERLDIKKVKWCTSPFKLFDCTRIQNICAFEGLAPKVYEIGWIKRNGWCLYQVQDYVGDGEGSNEQVWRKCVDVAEKYGAIVLLKEERGGVWNSAGGKRVGFKSFGFKETETYKNRLTEEYGFMDEIEARNNKHWANYYGMFELI